MPSSQKNTAKDTTIEIIKLPDPSKITAQETAKIKSICQTWYDTVLSLKGFNGGMIVAKDGNIVFEKYSGTCHLPGFDVITDSTPMHIASISKTFTAMAVLKLWQDGKLNIDDEYSKYFTNFNYPGLTIRCLLNHRSGLPNYNYFMETLGWDKSHFVKNEDVLEYLITQKAALPAVLPPGTHFSYCNTNYALLALLIEKISGLKYATYMQRNFFAPLQMKHTYVFSLADTITATPSYNWRGQLEAFNFLDQVYGDKNIYATPRDLLIWDRALCSGLIFKQETLDAAYAPYSNEKPGMRNYGLGWRMNNFPDGNKIIYHNGWWHGSNATFIRLLKEKATIIVIGNKFTRAVYYAKVLTSIFGNYYLPVEEEETSQKDSLKMWPAILNTDTEQKHNSKKTKNALKDSTTISQ
jgi:CubicO group peptidase (beta-lactamase class C family)